MNMKLNESINSALKNKLIKEANEIAEEQIAELVTMLCDGTGTKYYNENNEPEEILADLDSNGEAWVTCSGDLYGYSEIWLYKENNSLKMVISFKLTENDHEAPYANLVAIGYDDIKKMIENLEAIYDEVTLPWLEAVEELAKKIKSSKYGISDFLGVA